jgi:hypothetical protein
LASQRVAQATIQTGETEIGLIPRTWGPQKGKRDRRVRRRNRTKRRRGLAVGSPVPELIEALRRGVDLYAGEQGSGQRGVLTQAQATVDAVSPVQATFCFTFKSIEKEGEVPLAGVRNRVGASTREGR